MTSSRGPGRKVRLLIVSSVWPHVASALEAANVVTHSIVLQLLASCLFDIDYAYINYQPAKLSVEAADDLEMLRRGGVHFLPELLLPEPTPLAARPRILLKALLVRPEAILNGYGAGHRLLGLLGDRQVDAVLTIWSELGLNAACEFPALRFAYHGNPDHKVFDALHEVHSLTGTCPRGLRGFVADVRRRTIRWLLERAHLSVLRRYQLVANVAANDAAYYESQGVSACYLRNMWPAPQRENWEAQRDNLEATNPGKLIGSIGNTSATGNSLGFIALGREVLPALKARLGEGSFEVHIFGGREPKPAIRSLLSDPHIRLRGFVADLDSEILSAPVFLISNNHHSFKVGHTRFLHAWSLGACVVAFSDCREAMPEIEHGLNALLGDSAEDVANMVAQALADRELRRRIGSGGMRTLTSKFAPTAVVAELMARMQKVAEPIIVENI